MELFQCKSRNNIVNILIFLWRNFLGRNWECRHVTHTIIRHSSVIQIAFLSDLWRVAIVQLLVHQLIWVVGFFISYIFVVVFSPFLINLALMNLLFCVIAHLYYSDVGTWVILYIEFDNYCVDSRHVYVQLSVTVSVTTCVVGNQGLLMLVTIARSSTASGNWVWSVRAFSSRTDCLPSRWNRGLSKFRWFCPLGLNHEDTNIF